MALIINGEVIEDAVFLEERKLLAQNLTGDQHRNAGSYRTAEWVSNTARQNVISRVVLFQQVAQDTRPVSEEAIEAALKKRRGSTHSSICGPGEREQIEQQIRVDRLLTRITKSVHPPRQRDVDRYYKMNRSQFAVPESIHIRHIVKNVDELSKEEDALAILSKAREELDAGKDFGKVADRYSDCAGSGGDLNWISPGEMVEEFDAVVFSLKPKEISDIFQTRFGFHIAQLLERRPAGIKPLEEVRRSLSAQIFEANRQQAIAAFVDDLARQADIRTIPNSSKVVS